MRSIREFGLSSLALLASLSNIVVAEMSSQDYYIHSLPGQPEGPLVKMHAGMIEVDAAAHGNLFFWHAQNNHIDAKQRTVIWLNGGPGCSSMDGALMEVGPYRMKDDKNLEKNPGSWHEFANLLFVDQPVGTGFSYIDQNALLHELSEMANHFMIFLEKFFKLFPEYEHDEIFISGESYAGQHIPYIAQAIVDRNEKTTGVKWNVAGLLIGNGWIDPRSQYPAYLDFAYKNNLITKGSDIAKKLEARQAQCMAELESKGNNIDMGSCEMVLQDILALTATEVDGQRYCYNMYDIKLKDTYPSCGMNWPPDLKYVTPYLRRKEVKEALHATSKETGWSECSGSVSNAFRARNSKPSIELLPGLLEKMPILLFSGESDLICNHIGTENLINNMTWNGGKGFETAPGVWAPRTPWEFEHTVVGQYQAARNLTYVLIHNSSHMVPFDLPRQSRDMLDRFVGVDISSIGGEPAKVRVGGEDSPPTSVGGTANSTQAVADEQKKLDEARWEAYRRSGEIALIFVAIAAVLWGIFIWRQRAAAARHSGRNGVAYSGLARKRDVEEGEFDESELDDLHVVTPMFNRDAEGDKDERYSIGGDSSEDEEVRPRTGQQRGGKTE